MEAFDLLPLAQIRMITSKLPEKRSYEDIILIRTSVLKSQFYSRIAEVVSLVKLDELCSKMTYQSFEKGQAIFRQGDVGNDFYLILTGQCEIRIKTPIDANGNYDGCSEKVLFVCTSGNHFGTEPTRFHSNT